MREFLANFFERRQMARIPPTRIGDAPRRGNVRLSCWVSGEATEVAPLSGRPCAAYKLSLVEWDNGATYPCLELESTGAFEVDDGSGIALIEPVAAGLRLHKHSRRTGNSLSTWTPFVALMERHGLPTHDEEGQERSVDWREWVLMPGDELEIAGRSAWGFANPVAYRQRREELIMRASPHHKLLILANGRKHPGFRTAA